METRLWKSRKLLAIYPSHAERKRKALKIPSTLMEVSRGLGGRGAVYLSLGEEGGESGLILWSLFLPCPPHPTPRTIAPRIV